ncbi:MAG: HAD-IIB family hydrolase [Cyanobacteria bacterium P01_D01_bin.105]
MTEPSQKLTKLLVATDLDATLLDHQTYRYAAALPAIATLKSHGCPIIFNSSKTRAEQALLREELGLSDPFIVENGSAVIIPAGQLKNTAEQVKVFGPTYETLTAQIAALRAEKSYQFQGFVDLDTVTLANITGLTPEKAEAAKQRSGSEPLQWQDSEAAYEAFVADLKSMGLQTTQGGRFRHVMANSDKGQALSWLVNRYRAAHPETKWIVVALGDSPNDMPMLQMADVGVRIPNPHRAPFEVSGVKRLIQPEATGPAGWATAIAQLVREYIQ